MSPPSSLTDRSPATGEEQIRCVDTVQDWHLTYVHLRALTVYLFNSTLLQVQSAT